MVGMPGVAVPGVVVPGVVVPGVVVPGVVVPGVVVPGVVMPGVVVPVVVVRVVVVRVIVPALVVVVFAHASPGADALSMRVVRCARNAVAARLRLSRIAAAWDSPRTVMIRHRSSMWRS
jgi:hypothetical protein